MAGAFPRHTFDGQMASHPVFRLRFSPHEGNIFPHQLGTATAMLISIKNYSFEITEPYAEGMEISLAEAQALNALRADNIRNALSRSLEKLVAEHGQVLPIEYLIALKAECARRNETYEFEVRKAPKVQGPRSGSFEAIALEVATEWIDRWAAETGQVLDDEQRASQIASTSLREDVMREAHQRLSIKQQVASSALSELQL